MYKNMSLPVITQQGKFSKWFQSAKNVFLVNFPKWLYILNVVVIPNKYHYYRSLSFYYFNVGNKNCYRILYKLQMQWIICKCPKRGRYYVNSKIHSSCATGSLNHIHFDPSGAVLLVLSRILSFQSTFTCCFSLIIN